VTNTDRGLMEAIRGRWQDALAAAVLGTAIPESFLAALVANESGGNPEASRFEPGVLAHLWSVLVGRAPRYGSIGKADLENYVFVTGSASLAADVFPRLDELAHSWGLTQIMGYHILEWISVPGWYRTVDDLRVPEHHLRCTTLLLTQFANSFELDLGHDFQELLHCWNAGSPMAPTFDPSYVAKALARMDLYGSLQPASE
jgi:hypothetical protein